MNLELSRREFLKLSAVGAATTLFGSALLERPKRVEAQERLSQFIYTKEGQLYMGTVSQNTVVETPLLSDEFYMENMKVHFPSWHASGNYLAFVHYSEDSRSSTEEYPAGKILIADLIHQTTTELPLGDGEFLFPQFSHGNGNSEWLSYFRKVQDNGENYALGVIPLNSQCQVDNQRTHYIVEFPAETRTHLFPEDPTYRWDQDFVQCMVYEQFTPKRLKLNPNLGTYEIDGHRGSPPSCLC